MLYYLVENKKEIRECLRKLRLEKHCYPMQPFQRGEATQLGLSANTIEVLRLKYRDNKNFHFELLLSESKEINIPSQTYRSIQGRIHFLEPEWMGKPPGEDVIEEIVLLLLSRADNAHAVFLGRDIELGERTDPANAAIDGLPFACDICSGKRSYMWRLLKHEPLTKGNLNDRFPNLKEWLSDPDARVILSISSGGVRCYGVSPALNLLDKIEVRDCFDEIWGTSGGAIVAQLYGARVPPEKIEEMAFHIYQRRYPNVPFFRSKFRMTRAIARGIFGAFKSKASLGLMSMRDPLKKILNAAEKWKCPNRQDIPVYTVATDLLRRGPVVFTEERKVAPYLKNMVYPSHPWPACLPSSLVPLLFPPLKMKVGQTDLLCCDGAIAEELPLMMPFLKWYRDRHNRPEETPKKLKIFYLDFANHLTEKSLRSLSGKMNLNLSRITAEVLDILLSRPKYNFLAVAEEMPNVEVMGARFDVGRASLLDANQIPSIISAARAIFADQLTEVEENLVRAKAKGVESSEHKLEEDLQSNLNLKV